MVKWYFKDLFLEHQELLFIICMIVLVLIILFTIYFDFLVLKKDKHENK